MLHFLTGDSQNDEFKNLFWYWEHFLAMWSLRTSLVLTYLRQNSHMCSTDFCTYSWGYGDEYHVSIRYLPNVMNSGKRGNASWLVSLASAITHDWITGFRTSFLGCFSLKLDFTLSVMGSADWDAVTTASGWDFLFFFNICFNYLLSILWNNRLFCELHRRWSLAQEYFYETNFCQW